MNSSTVLDQEGGTLVKPQLMANILILYLREKEYSLIIVANKKNTPLKNVPFHAYANFCIFHSLVLKEKSLSAVKIYSFLGKKKPSVFILPN